jgi:hypothetical protein
MIAVYTLCEQDIEALDVASQEWQQLPTLLASLLSFPHVRADGLGAQSIAAVCDLMAYAQSAAAVAATDDSSAQNGSLRRKFITSVAAVASNFSLHVTCAIQCS